jgi:CheY-like chemotaxis protein
VDDDPMMLRLLNAALPRYGFSVWSAANGPAALEVYRRQRDDIAVVLLDVRMPGLDGPQTLAELQRLNHDVACCFMSGYAGDYSDEDLLARGALHCFSKPFHLDEIAQALWQATRRRVRQGV